ncbi:hypothetical protein V7S43_005532 [Phytophthora oleae]|uniref:Uncharacterized protein n=1 Tax=Phytophthora oleae TaxID=2107226 RepID=A0ABD3FR32_9STRA
MVGKGRQGRSAPVQTQVAGGDGQPDGKSKVNPEEAPSRLTPYQRMRQILAGEGNHQTRTISTVEELQAAF